MMLTPWYTRVRIDNTEVLLKLMTIAVFFAINTGLNNSSLLYLTLSANQIIRALLPATCAVFATFIEGKRYTGLQWFTMFILVIGVILALLDNPSFDELGTILCLISVIGAALHVSVVGYFLGGNLKLSAFDILFYTTIPIALILLPPFLVSNEIGKLELFVEKEGWGRSVLLVTVGGFIAFLYNVIHYFFIHFTSSVYTTVAGNMKVALVVAFSFIFLDDDATVLNIVGLSIASVAFFANSYLEFRQKEKQKASPRPTNASDDRPDSIREHDRETLAKYDKLFEEKEPLISRSKIVS